MSSDRRLAVLRAIVEEYVATREPVGSRVLAERHRLGVSPATIRNDMAVLEEAGLIAQPHTSAGRIPTDQGYRLFVDRLAAVRPLTNAQRRAIELFLAQGVDFDDVLGRAGRLIAQLTGQVAVVQYPTRRRSTIRHLELVQVAPGRLLVIVITDSGAVEQRFVEIPEDRTGKASVPTNPSAGLVSGESTTLDDAGLADLSARFNVGVVGKSATETASALGQTIDALAPELRPAATVIGAALLDALQVRNDERIVLTGHANLARSAMWAEQSLAPILDALEEQVVLLGLLGEMVRDLGDQPVAVRIGREVGHEGLAEASVVTTGYGVADDSTGLSVLGAIGPTWMDYPGTMAAVRAVARYLNRILPT